MKIIRTPQAMQKQAKQWQAAGKSIGFVPTMGALHAAHLSLVEACRRENDITVISIFVNPTQFGPNEDYTRYPRNLSKDSQLLKPYGVDVIFAPEAETMFPPTSATHVEVNNLSRVLLGPLRPGHFCGVTTVVLKLFNIVSPARAYFGEKDYQQLQIIRQMVTDLNLDVKIVGCPLIREKDGLAMSSRNAYLNNTDRKNAAILYRTLLLGKQAIEKGEKNAAKIQKMMNTEIQQVRNASIDYVAVADPETLQPLTTVTGKTLLALAVRFGGTRLIDNIVVRARKKQHYQCHPHENGDPIIGE